MTEQELRAIVREAVERHLHGHENGVGSNFSRSENEAGPHFRSDPAGLGPTPPAGARLEIAPGAVAHASHAMFVLAAVQDGEGRCIIEPAVACTHCGYCTSYGH